MALFTNLLICSHLDMIFWNKWEDRQPSKCSFFTSNQLTVFRRLDVLLTPLLYDSHSFKLFIPTNLQGYHAENNRLFEVHPLCRQWVNEIG